LAAERETSGINAILPQMDEFIPMLVAFLILLAILAKWGWPAFDKVLEKRENTIRAALEKAEENRIESERVLKEYQDQLSSAREEAETIISEAKQQSEAMRSEVTAKAQAEADRIIAKARETIESEKKAAVVELQSSVADIAVAAMARVVEEDFSDDDHRRLIERSIEEVGNLNA
jgi:F-type H+-transporting ATPase subunit b